MMYCLDASIAVKWFFDSEPMADKSLKVLERIVKNPTDFVVPDLFFIEFSAVMDKKTNHDFSYSKKALKQIYEFGLSCAPSGEDALFSSLQLAKKYKLTLYDSIYLATAMNFKAVWLTADVKATKKLSSSLYMELSKFS